MPRMSATVMKGAAGHRVRKGLSGSVVQEEKRWGPRLLFKKLNKKDKEGESGRAEGRKKGRKEGREQRKEGGEIGSK